MIDPREALRLWLATGLVPAPGTEAAAASLAETARLQGVAGLLHTAIEIGDGGGSGWPAPVRDRLRETHRALLARGIVQLDLVRRAQAVLERRGAHSLPLKGAAVAETYYPTVADRPMADVDLLLLGDWDAAMEALRAEGFGGVEASDHAHALRDAASGEVLELHHSVCSCPGFYPLEPGPLWERSRSAGGQIPRVPAAEDLLIQLSLHAAFQHGLVLSLVQYLDFRRLLDAAPPDAERLLGLAASSRAEAPVAVALAAAEAVVGARVAPALRERLRPHVPPGLAGWLARIARAPLSIVAPAEAPLFRVRFELAHGRRGEWLRRTLAPRSPSAGGEARRPLRAARRALALAGRWGPQILGSFRRPG